MAHNAKSIKATKCMIDKLTTLIKVIQDIQDIQPEFAPNFAAEFTIDDLPMDTMDPIKVTPDIPDKLTKAQEKEAKRLDAEAKKEAKRLDKEAKRLETAAKKEAKRLETEAKKEAKRLESDAKKAKKENKKVEEEEEGEEGEEGEENEQQTLVKVLINNMPYFRSLKTGLLFDYDKFRVNGDIVHVGKWSLNSQNPNDVQWKEEEEEEEEEE